MKTTENIALNMHPPSGRTTIRAPKGLKEEIDALLILIKEHTGVTFTRNDFMLKAIKHYIAHLYESKSIKDLKKELIKYYPNQDYRK